jgi:hypothetical protein
MLSEQLSGVENPLKMTHTLGRPVEVTALKMGQKIEDLITHDSYLKVFTVASECNISTICFGHPL